MPQCAPLATIRTAIFHSRQPFCLGHPPGIFSKMPTQRRVGCCGRILNVTHGLIKAFTAKPTQIRVGRRDRKGLSPRSPVIRLQIGPDGTLPTRARAPTRNDTGNGITARGRVTGQTDIPDAFNWRALALCQVFLGIRDILPDGSDRVRRARHTRVGIQADRQAHLALWTDPGEFHGQSWAMIHHPAGVHMRREVVEIPDQRPPSQNGDAILHVFSPIHAARVYRVLRIDSNRLLSGVKRVRSICVQVIFCGSCSSGCLPA